MCGIAGFVNLSHGRDVCEAMTDVIAHRGPDDAGIESVAVGRLSGFFGHRRLAIFDLSSAGHQPMRCGRWSVVFNGEIYNFKALRKELESYHCVFSSECDTEVLCRALEIWGTAAIEKLNGMFAVAATDGEKLYLFRDRNGVKPLYYFLSGKGIAFASEMGALECLPDLRREINPQAYFEYLTFGYVPAPLGIYQNTYKVFPGHCIVWQDGKLVEDVVFYDQKLEQAGTFGGTEEEAVNQLDELLTDAVSLRLAADRPLGCWLSGGIDSSLTSAIAQKLLAGKLKTYSIGFSDPKFNEAPYAEQVAKHLGTEHDTEIMDASNLAPIVEQLPEITGEPFADSSILPTLLLSKISRKTMTVIVSGDGGDEFFWGYPPYWLFDRIRGSHRYMPDFVRWQGSKLLQFFSPERAKRWSYRDISELHTYGKGIFSYQTFPELTGRRFPLAQSSYHRWYRQLVAAGFPSRRIWPWLDQKFYLTEVLQKVDLASMRYALEVRSPLLDFRVTDFANSLPDEFKVRNGSGKYLLKKLLERYVPSELFEREKCGFGAPIGQWMKVELSTLLKDILFSGKCAKENPYLSTEVARKLYQQTCALEKAEGFDVWTLFMFELWRQKKGAFFG